MQSFTTTNALNIVIFGWFLWLCIVDPLSFLVTVAAISCVEVVLIVCDYCVSGVKQYTALLQYEHQHRKSAQ